MDNEKVTYERLFNLGNYEHEKFLINGDVPIGTNKETVLKNAAVFCLELEEEIAKFRRVFQRRGELFGYLYSNWRPDDANKAEAEKKLVKLNKIIDSFKEEHRPMYRECKCFYCQHPELDENYDERD